MQLRGGLACRWLRVALAIGLQFVAHAELKISPAVEKALAATKTGDFVAAEGYFREALKTQPQSIELWNGLGVALNRQERFGEAADAFRTGLRINPAIHGIQLNLGIALYRAGKFGDAAGVFEKLPDQPQARELLAMSFVSMERYDAALPMLQQFAATSTDPTIHIALATCYTRLGKSGDAEKAVAHMFEVVGDTAPLHMALADASEREGDIEQAIAEFRKASKLDPSLAGAHLGAGRLLWSYRRFDEAEPELLAELKLNPSSIELKYYLGCLYLYTNDTARAIPLLEEFVRARPQAQNGYFELGSALVKENKTERAIWAFEKAVSMGPGEPNLHYALARAYRAAGRAQDAQKEFDITKRLLAQRSIRDIQMVNK